MDCNKCKVAVPAEFEYILSKNVCPKCGNKLMPDQTMKAYIDLKKKLHQVEFVMDKTMVCERIAMFLVTNYDIAPINENNSKNNTTIGSKSAVETFKAQLESLEDLPDISSEEIRAEEAARAEEISIAREMGMDIDGDEELISGGIDEERIRRLKSLASENKNKPIRRLDA